MSIESDISPGLARRSEALVLIAAALAVVYIVVPVGASAESLRIIAPAIGFGAVLIGIATHQPRRALGWILVASSLALYAVAAVLWSTRHFDDATTFPSIVDAFRLVAIVLMVGALLVLSQDSRGDGDTFGPTETAIVSIAVGVAVWLFVIEPYVTDRSLAFGDKVWATTIPLLSAFALATAFRLAAQSRFRQPSSVLLFAGLAVGLLFDALRSVLELRSTYGPGGVVASSGSAWLRSHR